MSVSRFPVEITADEAAFGFAKVETSRGLRVAADLGNRLRALKAIADDGSFEYVICDESFEPLYFAAKTLAELDTRFHAHRKASR